LSRFRRSSFRQVPSSSVKFRQFRQFHLLQFSHLPYAHSKKKSQTQRVNPQKRRTIRSDRSIQAIRARMMTCAVLQIEPKKESNQEVTPSKSLVSRLSSRTAPGEVGQPMNWHRAVSRGNGSARAVLDGPRREGGREGLRHRERPPPRAPIRDPPRREKKRV
jgi:hypothetical protein